MKEHEDWVSRLLVGSKCEHTSICKDGVDYSTLNGELKNGWSFCMSVLSDKEKKHTSLFLDCKVGYSHKKVDICFPFDINLSLTMDYIMSYNPSTSHDVDPYRVDGSLDSLHLLQYHLCHIHGYNSYRADIKSDDLVTLTLYTYCYSVAITYNLCSEKVELCFYPKDDDKYFLAIEYPIGMYRPTTIIGNWETDYYGKLLDSHSVSEPEEEEVEEGESEEDEEE